MKTLLKGLSLIFVVLMLSGCFEDAPSEAEIKQQIAEQTQQITLGTFELQKVEKLNSFKPDEKHYQVKIRQTFKVVKNPDQVLKEVKESSELTPLQKMWATMVLGAVTMSQPDLKLGDTFGEEKVYEFIKTEQGWRLSRVVEDRQL